VQRHASSEERSQSRKLHAEGWANQFVSDHEPDGVPRYTVLIGLCLREPHNGEMRDSRTVLQTFLHEITHVAAGLGHGRQFLLGLMRVCAYVGMEPYRLVRGPFDPRTSAQLATVADSVRFEELLFPYMTSRDDVLQRFATPSTALDRADRLPARRGFDAESDAMPVDEEGQGDQEGTPPEPMDLGAAYDTSSYDSD